MKYFKEFVTRDQQITQAQKMLSVLPKAYSLYKSLINNFTVSLNENFYDRVKKEKSVEWFIKTIIDNEKFANFIEQTYNTEVKRTYKEPKYDFGYEGIVFFYENDICIKFNRSPEYHDPQFEIACELSGQLELVPIIDCFDAHVEGITVPAIVMKTLKVAEYTLSKDVEDAYTALGLYMGEVLDKLKKDNIEQEISHSEVGAHLDPENAIATSKQLLQTKKSFFISKDAKITPIGEAAIRDMITIIKEVYSQTAWLFGRDIKSGRNIGIDQSGKHIPFDLGIGLRTRNLPPPKKKSITID
jgi:hypothetical protein